MESLAIREITLRQIAKTASSGGGARSCASLLHEKALNKTVLSHVFLFIMDQMIFNDLTCLQAVAGPAWYDGMVNVSRIL